MKTSRNTTTLRPIGVRGTLVPASAIARRGTRLNKAQRQYLDLLTQVIDAIGKDWEPGLAAFLALGYAISSSQGEFAAMGYERGRALRFLGTRKYALAFKTMGSDRAVLEWLSKPAAQLRGRRPRDLLETKAGGRRIERLLMKLYRTAPTHSRLPRNFFELIKVYDHRFERPAQAMRTGDEATNQPQQ